MDSILSQIPLFADLPAPAAAQLESRMKRRDFPPQAEIVREGGAGDAAFFVVSGRVAIRRRDPMSGFEFQVAERGPGEMFGEISLLTGRPRTATVVALEATTCAVLERAALIEIGRQQPDVALALTAMLAERLDRANQNIGLDFVSLSRTELRGRIGVYEVLRMTPRLRQVVGSHVRTEEIHAAAVEQGMVELKRYAAILLTEGLTTVEEVTGVVAVD